MPAFNDGNVPSGVPAVVTIGATAYIPENVSFQADGSATVIERRDEDGDPSGQVVVAGFGNGSVTLQLATTLTVVPAVGATFTLTRNGGATPATVGCVITEAGEAYSQLEARKVNVSFRRRYNS